MLTLTYVVKEQVDVEGPRFRQRVASPLSERLIYSLRERRLQYLTSDLTSHFAELRTCHLSAAELVIFFFREGFIKNVD